jgi:hypothetical protein
MSTLRFIAAAFTAGVAYIDCDGCILKKFPVPSNVPMPYKLLWWTHNLEPTVVIRRRLPLLYFLYFIGVRLVLWTNREYSHCMITRQALGKHVRIFSMLRFRGGTKILDRLDGPVMDDDRAYLPCGKGAGLLVKSL